MLPLEPISSVCVGSNLLKSRDSSVVTQNKLCMQEHVIVVRFPDEAKNLVLPWAHSGVGGRGVMESFLAGRAARA